ncbi:MAG: right-handed parallel beta-helix repeat-containing protein [Paludibacter sp.]|nr:right-handed parallel beta-helix repeat-containing protein [Paludibacter sp.]
MNLRKIRLTTINALQTQIAGIILLCLFSISSAATNYYVSLDGDNSYNGLTPDSAWRTITYSAIKARAGDTIFIKGGNYGHEHVTIYYPGTSTNPIVYKGYDGTPVLDAGDYDGKAISLYGKPYVTIKNIRVANYRYGIWVDGNSHHVIIDSCIADSCCNTNYAQYGYDGYGFVIQSSNYCELRNCSATDNGGNNYFLSKSNYCTLDNCSAYSVQTANNQYITDYYFVLAWSSYNTIRNCYAEDVKGSYKGNHGFIVKDGGSGTLHSTGNLFINCTAKKFEECFSFAHGAYENKFDSCYADNTGKRPAFGFCLQNRDGAYDNIFSNCTAVGLTGVVSAYSGTESAGSKYQNNTLFENCVFKGAYNTTIGVYLRNAKNTTFKNCTYVNLPNLFRFSKSSSGSDLNTGTVLRNCILSGVKNPYDNTKLSQPWSYGSMEAGYDDMGDVSISHTDFWGGFEQLPGSGNIAVDPLFADSINSDFHLKSEYGRWNGLTWVNDDVSSPCINAGNPDDAYNNEPAPNGGRINMGAYGNTAEASMHPGVSGVESISENSMFTCYIKGQNLLIGLSSNEIITGTVFVSITTMDGRRANLSYKNENQIMIDISPYPKGIILCTVSTNRKTESFKLLID